MTLMDGFGVLHIKVAQMRKSAAPAPKAAASSSPTAVPPEGLHPDAGRRAASLTPPPGGTQEQVALRDRIFHGEVANGTCGRCHGSNGSGSPVGADLTTPGPKSRRGH